MTLKHFLLTFFVSLVIQISFSQKNFESGYVVTTGRDTLYGLIDYQNWEKNPDNINFKIKDKGVEVNYTALELKEFGVKDEIYLSAIVDTETSTTTIGKMKPDPALKIRKDTTFLQAIILGEKSLFLLKNKEDIENFYILKGGVFELLEYKKYLRVQQEKQIIAEVKNYVNQLTLYLTDCPNIQSKIFKSIYKQESLEKVFLFYYKNRTQSDIKFYKPREKVKTDIGALGGMSITTLNFTNKNLTILSQADFSVSTNISTGIYFDVVFPRNRRKWSIYNEIIVSSYKSKAEKDLFVFIFDYVYLKANNMLRFKFPIGKGFVFVNGGMSNGYAIKEAQNVLRLTRRYEQGLILGVGGRLKKFTFEARIEKANGVSAFVDLDSDANRTYFLLGYRFNN